MSMRTSLVVVPYHFGHEYTSVDKGSTFAEQISPISVQICTRTQDNPFSGSGYRIDGDIRPEKVTKETQR